MYSFFDKSKAFLDIARTCWSKRNQDQVYINLACYNLQQSMEMALNCIIEQDSKVLIQRNLGERLELVSDSLKDKRVFALLEENINTYMDWETSSRYRSNFTVSAWDVKTAFQVCSMLLNVIEKQSGYYDKQRIITEELQRSGCTASVNKVLECMPTAELKEEDFRDIVRFIIEQL